MQKRVFLLLLTLPFLISPSGKSAGYPLMAESQKSTISVSEQQIDSKPMDDRARILQEYLSGYNSPLQNHTQDFVEAADLYGLDWKLVAAISGVESTFGKAIPGGYNAWGWGVYGTQAIYFKSWKDGIYTVSAGLRQNYFDKGLTNPYEINRIYAASSTWGSHVSYFLRDIENFEKDYRFKNSQKLAFIFKNQIGNTSANPTYK